MIAQRLPDEDDDTPSGWAIVLPLLFIAAGGLAVAAFCFVKAYGAN